MRQIIIQIRFEITPMLLQIHWESLDGGILLQLWRVITPIQAGNYSSMFSKHIGIRGRHGYKQTIAIHATANYSNHF